MLAGAAGSTSSAPTSARMRSAGPGRSAIPPPPPAARCMDAVVAECGRRCTSASSSAPARSGLRAAGRRSVQRIVSTHRSRPRRYRRQHQLDEFGPVRSSQLLGRRRVAADRHGAGEQRPSAASARISNRSVRQPGLIQPMAAASWASMSGGSAAPGIGLAPQPAEAVLLVLGRRAMRPTARRRAPATGSLPGRMTGVSHPASQPPAARRHAAAAATPPCASTACPSPGGQSPRRRDGHWSWRRAIRSRPRGRRTVPASVLGEGLQSPCRDRVRPRVIGLSVGSRRIAASRRCKFRRGRQSRRCGARSTQVCRPRKPRGNCQGCVPGSLPPGCGKPGWRAWRASAS